MPPPRYIRVSEINTFVYCKRAWYLSQHGAESSLAQQRAAGVGHHQAHGDRVQTARAAASIAPWFGIAALLLLAAFVWLVLR